MGLPVRRDRSVPARGDGALGELSQLHARLSQYLDELASWLPALSWGGGGSPALADVEETDDAYVVEVELPGVAKPDVDVELSGRRLTVAAERKERARSGFFRHRSRTVGQLYFEVTLPGDIADERVSADLADGVLTVRLPKPEADRRRRITIT